MNYDGTPAGRAGIGKNETVKCLGRTLGVFAIVTNWSGEHKYRDMAKIFKCLCQSGLWDWLSGFNWITFATLFFFSAQLDQFQQLKGLIQKYLYLQRIWFLSCLWINYTDFIIMNHEYAGRQEFSENI